MAVRKHSPLELKLVKAPEAKKARVYTHHNVWGTRHIMLIKAFSKEGMFTDEELSGYLNTSETDSRGRRAELVRMGYVEFAQATRKTTRGRKANTWRLTEMGIKKAQELLQGDKK